MKLFSYLLFASLIIFSASCTKDDNDDGVNYGTPHQDTTSVDSLWHFSMDIDGITVSGMEDSTIEGEWHNSQVDNTAPDSSIKNYGSAFVDMVTFMPILDVNRNGQKFLGLYMPDSLVGPYFTPGTYNFSIENEPGVSIHWMDSTGTMWGTDLGVADQTGSEFTIEASQQDTSFTDYTIKVRAHFNCTFYNSNNGDTKSVTNGEYTGSFQNYF
jgi:hypothetical protein